MFRMTDGKISRPFEVHGWAMLSNGWEYYFLDDKRGEDIRFALVVGDETEMGDVSMKEIEPYVEIRTDDLTDILPPPGWEWV